MHKKMLTWENLRKKGFIGPSRCPMCRTEEETMNHLLNTYDWANSIWNWAETILQRMDRVMNSIQETIENWSGNFSNTQVVNTIWKLILGFIPWTIWKQRNQRVFLNENRSINHLKDSILQNIKQTIIAKGRMEQNKNISSPDLQILKAFNINMESFTSSGIHQQDLNTSVNS